MLPMWVTELDSNHVLGRHLIQLFVNVLHDLVERSIPLATLFTGPSPPL